MSFLLRVQQCHLLHGVLGSVPVCAGAVPLIRLYLLLLVRSNVSHVVAKVAVVPLSICVVTMTISASWTLFHLLLFTRGVSCCCLLVVSLPVCNSQRLPRSRWNHCPCTHELSRCHPLCRHTLVLMDARTVTQLYIDSVARDCCLRTKVKSASLRTSAVSTTDKTKYRHDGGLHWAWTSRSVINRLIEGIH